ncbi:hypothetical protein os1_01050 [Comamonadaceae bacterium OS-1]|nr:hypothetical protein os1_01050 [Comamonadaceae bacterium OS-1]
MKEHQGEDNLRVESPADSTPEDAAKADTLKAIASLQGKDKVGRAGELLGIASGAVAGTSLAGAVAGAAGATTLLGSGTLAGVLGGVFVTATPVGWVIGAAAAGAAAAYGITKLVRSGATQDHIRAGLTRRLKTLAGVSDSPDPLRGDLDVCIADALNAGNLDSTQAARILSLVDKGRLPIDVALERVRGLDHTI